MAPPCLSASVVNSPAAGSRAALSRIPYPENGSPPFVPVNNVLMSYFRRSCILFFVLSCCAFAQLRQVAVVDVPGRPGFDQLAFANGMLVMSHSRADSLDIFNPQLRRLEKQITGLSDPRGLAVDDAGKRIFVANAGNNTIAVISTDTWTVARTIPLNVPPDSLLWVPETKTLYAASARTSSIIPVHDDGTAGAAIIFLGRPSDLVFDPGRKLLYVTLQDQKQIAVVDADGKLTRTIDLQAWQPTGMALDASSNRLFVAVRYAVLVLDPATGAELARIPSAPGVDTLWLDNASHDLYVAASGGSVSIIQFQNGRYVTVAELQTKVHGHTLAFDPVKKLVYMPGGAEGHSRVLILRRTENPNRPTPVVAGQPQANTDTAPKLAEKKQ